MTSTTSIPSARSLLCALALLLTAGCGGDDPCGGCGADELCVVELDDTCRTQGHSCTAKTSDCQVPECNDACNALCGPPPVDPPVKGAPNCFSAITICGRTPPPNALECFY